MASWGSCDYKQLLGLQKRLEKLQKADMQKFCEAASRELAARLLALVIPRTPVGRKPRVAAKDENDKKALGGVGAKKTLNVKTLNADGKRQSRAFLTREGAILEQHWAGYMGGTLRRGWTAKTEGEAAKGGGPSAKEYADGLAVIKSGDNYQVTVINQMRYASYVEFGHRQKPGRYVPALGKRLKKSWVPGKHMLTISERQLSTIAPKLLEKKLQAFLTEVFHG